MLTGLVYVDSTYSMTIPAGTVIKGDTGAALVITRGAKIFATGTADRPVVFTSNKAPGQRHSGDWGGISSLAAHRPTRSILSSRAASSVAATVATT